MDTSTTQEKPVETASNQQRQCEPFNEQETILLDEVAQKYFKKVSEDMRGRVGLSPGKTVQNKAQIDALCTLDYCIRGIVAHAENIRKFENLPDKVTLPNEQKLRLEALFKLNEILDDLENIVQRMEELP